MGSQIVTVAMTTGANAVAIARLVADRLSFQYVNDEIIDGAAAQAGVSREAVADVERSPSLMSRIMTALASGAVGASAGPVSMDQVNASPSYQRLIQNVIREMAAKGHVVIVAHGASILLAGTPGLLRVLVTASPAIRARRLAAEAGRDERWAAREIERTDGERRSFFKRLHDLDEELATHYDLVVNTDTLSVDEAARVIIGAAGKGGVLGGMLDITARKHAEEERAQLLVREREARSESETLNRVGRLLAAELDYQKLVQTVTDAGTVLCGAAVGAFDPSFTGVGIVRCDDVTQDERYGTRALYPGFPEGHGPVRSYLAVPVTSRAGDVLGGLFFGHPEPARFTERHERMVGGLAAQAAVAMDNARLYETAEKERLVAEDANRAKDEFLATMSHELRTPLNAVLGWARMLRSGQVAQAQTSHALEVIERNARAQAQLVEDILDVSRIITGKLRLVVTAVELTTVIDAALEVVRLAAQSKGIELQAALDPAAGAVNGDAGRLQQVVWNLLSNAVKFTPQGGRVLIRLERAGMMARIVVSDTGSGIGPEFLPYVFDRFRQADSTSTRAHSGLGLGLAIVRHIVEQHGGHVRADSAGLGEGASFTVEIPLRVSAPGTDALAEATEMRRNGTLASVKVLLVDDEPDSRELTTVLLEASGAEVVAVVSAADALIAVEADPPNVVVSDIGMPGEDGYAFIRQLRARGHRVPAIALTAYGREQDRQRALAEGFHEHVSKPADAAALAAVIAAVLAGR